MQPNDQNVKEHPENRSPSTETRESNQSLWLLTAAPLIWATHFLASYLTAAIWCAKVVERSAPLDTVRVAIAIYTVLALAGIGLTGWVGYRRQAHGDESTPHHDDTPEDRHRFLGFATLLLAGLSAVATIYVALAAVFLETCY